MYIYIYICIYIYTQNQDENNQQRDQRKRKIIAFNPPYSLNTETSKSSFSKSSKISQIFSCNTMKISYCFIKNMGLMISFHNKQVLQPRNENYGCNCRKKENCPLDNNVLSPTLFTKLIFLITLTMSIKSN